MGHKAVTVEEKQRELIEEAVQASRKCFAALREARAYAATVSLLSDAETKLIADAKATAANPGDVHCRRIANYPLIIPELLAGNIPLDSMEAEASAAREQMKAF
jgi:hypothetical protein